MNLEELSRVLNRSISDLKVEPVNVNGLQRAWLRPDKQYNGLTITPTYLVAYLDLDSECNGILLDVLSHELEILDKRELPAGYIRILIAENIWCYIMEQYLVHPSSSSPIVQTYVDLCINGCLMIDQILNDNYDFTEQFIKTTSGWNGVWINDRLIPYRPLVHEPNANLINKLLGKYLDLSHIKIKLE